MCGETTSTMTMQLSKHSVETLIVHVLLHGPGIGNVRLEPQRGDPGFDTTMN